MASSTKPKPPREHEVQKAIVDALRLCGLTVYETTAYRQKGSSGVDKGIPDLLVSFDKRPHWYLGMEVKRPGTVAWSSPEQRAAHEDGRFLLVQSAAEAVEYCLCFILDNAAPTDGTQIRKMKSVLEGLS